MCVCGTSQDKFPLPLVSQRRSGWPCVQHYSGGLTFYTPDGTKPSSLGEFRVSLKPLTLPPRPTHLFYFVAVLEFHSFLPRHFSGRNFLHDWSEPGWICSLFFAYNEEFTFSHFREMTTKVNSASFFICMLKSWNNTCDFLKANRL